jgi:alkylation response protein AidB-like acyl-CoA dehydrogenase
MPSVASTDQQLLEKTTGDFLAETAPLATVRGWSEGPGAGYPDDWWKRACSLGWIWLSLPERLGGGGVSGDPIADMMLVARQIGTTVAPGPVLGSSLLCLALAESDERHDPVLEALADGSAVGAWCLNEASFFADPRNRPLQATPDGTGYRISGRSSSVEYAAQATHLLVTAESPAGWVQALLAADAPGVSVSPRSSVELVRRYGVITLDGVSVAGDAVIAGPDGGRQHAERLLHVALAWQCVETVALMQHMFDATLKYLFDRFAFGRPLASYQALKHRVADMKLWLEASAATAAAASVGVAAGAPNVDQLASAAKSFVGAQACPMLQEAVQLHGGIGLTWEHDLHFYLRRATQNRAMFGDPARHRRALAVAAGLPEASP